MNSSLELNRTGARAVRVAVPDALVDGSALAFSGGSGGAVSGRCLAGAVAAGFLLIPFCPTVRDKSKTIAE